MLSKIKNYLIGYVNYIVYEPGLRYYNIERVIMGEYKHEEEKRTLIDSSLRTLFVLLIILSLISFIAFMVSLEIAIPILSLFILSLVVALILRALTK